jgi:hypothetical protein
MILAMTKLTRSDAVHILNEEGACVTYPTLSNWAQDKKGPAFVLEGGRALYDEDEVRAYAAELRARREKRGWK